MADQESETGTVFSRWLAEVNTSHIAYTLTGGLIGGMFSPLVRNFLKTDADFDLETTVPAAWDTWVLGMVFGAICAGFVVYVLTADNNRNRRQLFFIALAAGLTFPTVLSNTTGFSGSSEKTEFVTNAIENEEKAAKAKEEELKLKEEVIDLKTGQQKLTGAQRAEQTKEIQEEKIALTESSLDGVQDVARQTPKNTLKPDDRKKIAIGLEARTVDIARDVIAEKRPEAKKRLAEKLKDTVKVLSEAGYKDVAKNKDVAAAILK